MRFNSVKAGILSVCLLSTSFMFTSCEEDRKEVEPQQDGSEEISAAVIQRLKDLHFNTEGIQLVNGDYLVEGDMIITPEALEEMSDPVIVEGPKGEQYRTYNLVSTPRTIRVLGYQLNSTMSQGLNRAIANFNALNCGFTMQRTTSTSNWDIAVQSYGSGAGGVAGFPSGGNPYQYVNVYPGTAQYGVNVVEHVMTHELGHCMGMRHSDWFNRAISCGSGGNEGTAGVGAVHIPGTPSQPSVDANSIMLSCFSANESGNFSNYDRIALETIYPN
ncbi:M57 family metalloprotease [Fulvivirga sediminis]|uniref:Peptidase n=1 Tax=Fulvivirga sediminis TaxID=2803949 RepID=A0A937K245_9BACT|nr:M57 family metalloprotease [Fulvivirga sediminis]MBL3657985.1 peptidase [Fulvivirga sediminis]